MRTDKIWAVLALLVLLICARPLSAQANVPKNEIAAAGLELFLPCAGHAYAGDTAKCKKSAIVTGAGVATWLVAIGAQSLPLAILGFSGTVAGRVMGVSSAIQTADAYNAGLGKKVSMVIVPIETGQKTTLGVALKFRL